MFQLNLFKRKTAEQALELASWLRIEVNNLRAELKQKQTVISGYEKTLIKLEGMLTELKQKELFEDEPKNKKRNK